MAKLKTKELFRDYKAEPKTVYYCHYCGRDMKPDANLKMIHLIDGGDIILHPDSEADYKPDGGDLGLHPVGLTCAKKIGADWVHDFTPQIPARNEEPQQ